MQRLLNKEFFWFFGSFVFSVGLGLHSIQDGLLFFGTSLLVVGFLKAAAEIIDN